MFGGLLARIDAKKALPKLNATIQWLRIVEFACSVAIMGIFLSFSVNLPNGFTTSKRLVAVWALVSISNTLELWTQLIETDNRRCIVPDPSLDIAHVVSSVQSIIHSGGSGNRLIYRCTNTYLSCNCAW